MYARLLFREMGCVAIAVGLFGWCDAAFSQEPGSIRAAAFMRAKLTPTKEVLEGIALADFELIAKNAGTIRNLLLDENWMVVQSEEYRRQTDDFRKLVEELRLAALDKSIDRATLAYVQMTFQCVRCHKTLRTPVDIKPPMQVAPETGLSKP